MSEIKEFDRCPSYERPERVEGVARPVNLGKGLPLWSGPHDVPNVGVHINVTMNGIGPAVVRGYFIHDGYMGLLVDLLSPPDWYVKQNGTDTRAHIFGLEFQPGTRPMEIQVHGTRTAVHWQDESARYHVWVNDKGQRESVIYKNSLAPYGRPGAFETRQLDLGAKANADTRKAIDELLGDGQPVRDALAAERAAVKAEQDAKRAAHYAKVRENIQAMADDIRTDNTPRRMPDILDTLASEATDEQLKALASCFHTDR